MSEENVKIEEIATNGAIEFAAENDIDLFSLEKEEGKKLNKKNVEDYIKSLHDESSEDYEAPETYSKTCANPFNILGVEINKNTKLEDVDKSNELFMKKLTHAIKLGLIVKG